jgi:cytochrome c-type biogenesis protein CcmH/NrfG
MLGKDAKNAGGYQILDGAYLSQQKSEQALAAFSTVAKLAPNDASSYLSLALVDLTVRRFGDAETRLIKVVATGHRSVRVRIALANMCLATNS